MASVRVESVVRIEAKRTSPQAVMKAKMATATMPGRLTGMRIRNRAPSGRGAVDQGGLFELARDGVEVADEHPDRERQREGQVGDDQPQPGAVERDAGAALEVDEDHEQRQQEEDPREHLGREHGQGEGRPPAEAVAADGVGREDGQHDGAHGGRQGDDEAVEEVVRERDRLPDVDVGAQRHVRRDPREVRAHVAQRLDRRHDDRVEREERDEGQDQQPHHPGQAAVHGLTHSPHARSGRRGCRRPRRSSRRPAAGPTWPTPARS